MTRRKKRSKLTLDEALKAAAEIVARGYDAEMRSVDGGRFVIVYEIHKKVRKASGAKETPKE